MMVKLVIDMDYLAQDARSGRFRYRRRVPGELRDIIGKREFSISLKTSDQRLALDAYSRVHKEVEAQLEAARALDPADAKHGAALASLRKYGLIPTNKRSLEPINFNKDPEKFKRFTDAALSAPDAEFDHIVEAKFFGIEEPPVRLSKATEAYIAEHRGADNERDLQKQVKLAVSHLIEAMGESDPLVLGVNVDTAYRFRDLLRERGAARGTVQRRINTIRAVLNFAKLRFQLHEFSNPFSNLDVPKTASDRRAKDSRSPLSVGEIKRCNRYIMSKNEDISGAWVLMAFTGARPKELLGLERQDVDLDHPVPHIVIRPNMIRSVKTDTSIRKVPLVGQALTFLRQKLVRTVDDSGPLDAVFPRYASLNGFNTASALMSKAMRQAEVWEKTTKVPYSLRHSHKDWMRRVAPEYWVNLVHGHAQGGIAANYGGDDMLDQLSGYVERACRNAGIWDIW